MTVPVLNKYARDNKGYRKAIAVGIIFFVLGLLGAYLLFSWEQWRLSHLQIVYVGPYPKSNPAETDEIFIAVIRSIAMGLILLPVLAGAVTAWLLPAWKTRNLDAFGLAGLAGIVTLALISITFWALLIPDLLRTLVTGNMVNPIAYLLGIIINVVIILFGGLVAAIAGVIVRALAGFLTPVQKTN